MFEAFESDMSFFHRIFGRKVKKEDIDTALKEEVKFDKLEQWLDKKEETIFRQLNLELIDLFSYLEEQKKKLNQGISTLRTAKLQNENIHARERQILEGNKATYIKKTEQFLAQIQQPKEINRNTALFFCDDFNKKIDELGGSTQKAFQVLQFFHANEAQHIATTVKRMNDTVNKMKQQITEQKNVELLNHAVLLVEKIKQKQEIQKKVESELLDKQNVILELNKMKDAHKTKILVLEEGSLYKELQELHDEKARLDKEYQNVKVRFEDAFYPLQKALARFKREHARENLIDSYIADPCSAALADSSMEILNIICDLKTQIEQNTLGLKDKLKSKAIEAAGIVSKEYIIDNVLKLKEIKADLDRVRKRIETDETAQEHKKIKYKLDYIEEAIPLAQKEKNEIESRLNEIKIAEKISELQSKINEATKGNVTIIL